VTVAELQTAAPIANPDPLRAVRCERFGLFRAGYRSVFIGAFTRLGVSPDGSFVVFEVTDTNDFPREWPGPFPPPLERGIYRVRADGGGLHRIRPPSRLASFTYFFNPQENGFVGASSFDVLYRFSPDGRTIVFTDLGPGPDGPDAVQIVTLDIISGQYHQVTHFSEPYDPRWHVLPSATSPRFVDRDTVVFASYANLDGEHPVDGDTDWFTIDTDGTGLEAVSVPGESPGGQVRSTFEIASRGTNIVGIGLGSFLELFLLDGQKLLQLTNFRKGDTGHGGKLLDRDAGRGYFTASADPLQTNPSQNCQLFSVSTTGARLRQLTHFHEVDRSENGCFFPGVGDPDRPGCPIGPIFQDRVTKTIVFHSACDAFGTGIYGGQVFSVRPDGTGLSQLTAMRGLVRNGEGAVSAELPGPVAYSSPDGGRAAF
jgi:hypothetical protein